MPNRSALCAVCDGWWEYGTSNIAVQNRPRASGAVLWGGGPGRDAGQHWPRAQSSVSALYVCDAESGGGRRLVQIVGRLSDESLGKSGKSA